MPAADQSTANFADLIAAIREVLVPSRSPGFTVADVAKRYRVGEDKVRGWIRRRELRAINTAEPLKKPRYVIPPDAIGEFEKRRQAGDPPKPPRRKRLATKTFYPDIDFLPD
jgi:hypothetical protein